MALTALAALSRHKTGGFAPGYPDGVATTARTRLDTIHQNMLRAAAARGLQS